MMTQTSSRFPKFAVWLMLLAMVCMVMVPSMALAKKEMSIATEGDPGDGMDFAGGGGGGILEEGSSSSQENDLKFNNLPTFYFSVASGFDPLGINFQYICIALNYGKLQQVVKGSVYDWEANR